MYSRFQELLSESGLKIADVVKATGITQSTFPDWKSGRSHPKTDKLQKIANFFNVSVEWLTGTSEYRLAPYKSSLVRDDKLLVPVLGNVAAGIPIEAIEDILDYEEVSLDVAKNGLYFGLKIKGDSMSPRIIDGDVVIVRQQAYADSGAIVIAKVNGDDACCKKLVKNKSGITLQSLNPTYEPMYFSNEDIKKMPVDIIGVVVELRGKFI